MSSHSTADDDAVEVTAGDAISAANETERYWITCHVTESHLEAMAAEGLIPSKEDPMVAVKENSVCSRLYYQCKRNGLGFIGSLVVSLHKDK